MKEMFTSYQTFDIPTKNEIDEKYVLRHIKELIEDNDIVEGYSILDITENTFTFDCGDLLFDTISGIGYEAQIVGMFTDANLLDIKENKEEFYYIIKVENR